MPKKFKCPGCGTIVQAPDSAAGKNVKCPTCATVMKVPGPAPLGQQPPPGQQRSGQSPMQQSPPPSDPFGDLPDLPAATSPGSASNAFPSAPVPQPLQNPYAAPSSTSYGSQAPSGSGNPLKAPGIILCIIASIHLILIVLSLVLDVVKFANGVPLMPPNNAVAAPMNEGMILMLRFCFGFLFCAIQGTIAYGGISMAKLENKGTVRTALILSIIPLCSSCCLLGIPFGIWGWVTLPQVESRFRS